MFQMLGINKSLKLDLKKVGINKPWQHTRSKSLGAGWGRVAENGTKLVAGGCDSGDQAQEAEGEEKSSGGGGGGGVDRAKGGPATVSMYPWRRSRSRKRRSDPLSAASTNPGHGHDLRVLELGARERTGREMQRKERMGCSAVASATTDPSVAGCSRPRQHEPHAGCSAPRSASPPGCHGVACQDWIRRSQVRACSLPWDLIRPE
jgi:hypothetical protein